MGGGKLSHAQLPQQLTRSSGESADEPSDSSRASGPLEGGQPFVGDRQPSVGVGQPSGGGDAKRSFAASRDRLSSSHPLLRSTSQGSPEEVRHLLPGMRRSLDFAS